VVGIVFFTWDPNCCHRETPDCDAARDQLYRWELRLRVCAWLLLLGAVAEGVAAWEIWRGWR
jgi:hypothetical protein